MPNTILHFVCFHRILHHYHAKSYVSLVGVGFGLMRGLHFAIRFTICETFDQLFIIPALY